MKNKIQRIFSNNGDYIRVSRDVDVICPMLAVFINSIDVNMEPAFLCAKLNEPIEPTNIEACLNCKKNPFARED